MCVFYQFPSSGNLYPPSIFNLFIRFACNKEIWSHFHSTKRFPVQPQHSLQVLVVSGAYLKNINFCEHRFLVTVWFPLRKEILCNTHFCTNTFLKFGKKMGFQVCSSTSLWCNLRISESQILYQICEHTNYTKYTNYAKYTTSMNTGWGCTTCFKCVHNMFNSVFLE